jgi:hypothetical protein
VVIVVAPRFTEAGLILEFFELKRPNFSDEYESAVEQCQIVAVLIEQRRQETVLAQKEAERARIQAQGGAKRLEETGQAVRETPEILELERIRAITSANVAFIRSDGILPVLDFSADQSPTASGNPVPTPTPTP